MHQPDGQHGNTIVVIECKQAEMLLGLEQAAIFYQGAPPHVNDLVSLGAEARWRVSTVRQNGSTYYCSVELPAERKRSAPESVVISLAGRSRLVSAELA